MFSPYPVVPGSEIMSSVFDSCAFETQSQGNYTPLVLEGNVFSDPPSEIVMSGEVLFQVRNNEFNDSRSGVRIENTGDKMRNRIRNNEFNNIDRASSVFGDNNAEYLVNCFAGTNIVDIELNDSASIYTQQGTQNASAGNCFEDGARIQTGGGTEHFTYWTKDGYNNPTVCEHPGSGNFDIEESQEETEHSDCGIQDSISAGPIYCTCDTGLSGCEDAIDSIRAAIAAVDSNQFLTTAQKAVRKAEYERCLDDLMRQYVQEVLARGDAEDAIDYLSAQPEFPYRIMAYGIMVHNLEYDRAEGYLDTLSTAREDEEDFVEAQQIYLAYLTDIDSFTLSVIDSFILAEAGEKFNPYAGYARSIFYLLTRKWIERDFEHLDSTVTQRSVAVKETQVDNDRITVFPNPSAENVVNILIDGFEPESKYSVNTYTPLGEMIGRMEIVSEFDQVVLGDAPGMYILVILKDNRIFSTKRVIHN